MPRTFSTLLGGVLGATFGFLIYWCGEFLLISPSLLQMDQGALTAELMRAFYTITIWELVVVTMGGIIGLAVGRYRWRSLGLMSYIALIAMIGGFIVYAIRVSLPQVPPGERWLSYALFTAETAGLMLIVIFSFYSLDAATRKRWTRLGQDIPWDGQMQPKVAIQIPVFNEDFETVQQTVAHAVRQKYPQDRYKVQVLDDSTDQDLRRRLKAFCAQVGAQYVARDSRKGFKAGAINHATRLLPPDYELISIVDADYWIQEDFLRSVAGYFANPHLAFVQTPQDYRNIEESFLTRQYKRAEGFFYHAIMHSRNEQNAIIFCGTMGVIRRSALDDIGGFAEDQICEDAEVSVRFAARGWDSLYIDESFGKGLMPSVFEAYKKQYYRWAFGNVKILFTRTGTILRSRMSLRQKFDFIVSNLHWFDGFFVLAIASILLYMGLGPILGYDAVTHHQEALILLALVPLALVVDGIVRLHLVLRRTGKTTIFHAIAVQGMWFAIKFTIVTAVTKALLGFKSPFIRTPKSPGGRMGRIRSLFHTLRLTFIETAFGSALVIVGAYNLWQRPFELDIHAAAAVLLPVWLGLYGLFLLSAPIYAYLSYRTLRPLDYHGVPLPGPARNKRDNTPQWHPDPPPNPQHAKRPRSS
jgi:cellulose synthase/poly-beta-1,6-N-acetylglucosamine synthase-like glycosyltransferase